MSWWEAILLATVQGLTEFLPVSSSGHLALLQRLFAPFRSQDLSYTILLHLGTLLSLLVYFRRDLIGIGRALVGAGSSRAGTAHPLAGRELAWTGWLLAAMVPTAVIGIALRQAAVAAYPRPERVGLLLLVTAALLAAPRLLRRHGGTGKMNLRRALLVGTVQGLAVLPGISRSGSTIVAGILAGTGEEEAARFSFHLSIPTIVGAAVLEGMVKAGWRDWLSAAPLIGFVVAAVTGWIAIDLLLRAVAKRRLGWFAIYCAGAGIAALLLSAGGEP